MKLKIDHIGIWVENLEHMRKFYINYFALSCNEKYTNPEKRFSSYFLSFGNNGTRLELMNRPDIQQDSNKRGFNQGMAHFAISMNSAHAVDMLTEKLRNDGITIASEPRQTGDGYYESAILDPEGNYIEISYP